MAGSVIRQPFQRACASVPKGGKGWELWRQCHTGSRIWYQQQSSSPGLRLASSPLWIRSSAVGIMKTTWSEIDRNDSHQILCRNLHSSPVSYQKNQPVWLKRLLKDEERETGKQNWVLKLLGYYRPASRAAGAGRLLVQSAIDISESDLFLDYVGIPEEKKSVFLVRFQMLAIHVWMEFVRLRNFMNDGNMTMSTMSEVMFLDLQRRMIEEEEFEFMQSSKWTKEFERIFYGLAMSLDGAVYGGDVGLDFESEDAVSHIRASLTRNISVLDEDEVKVNRLIKYIQVTLNAFLEKDLDKFRTAEIWDESNEFLENMAKKRGQVY
mmetsp:Transcript_13606/g.23149  ORF Transcript_13606/g.23149 Transcript_13606/m.23149 type:complete len:323 (-) Transcript_13606:924-1892(-)